MMYDLSDGFDLERFRDKAVELQNKRAMVELKERKARSLSSNRYLHLMLSAFGSEFGYRLEEVKVHFYKLKVNRELFLRKSLDRFDGEEYFYVRSSADLTQEEMSTSIDSFRTWAKETAGFDFPTPDDYIALMHIEHDVERTKNYLQ